jgi:DNA-binding NarL/FixJ family response regulator
MTRFPKPTAVLTDDHPSALEAARIILRDEFEIVATAADGKQALVAVSVFHPTLLVLDVAMPGWSGFDTARYVANVSPATKILFLSIYEDKEFAAKARQFGASYVLKHHMRGDLLKAAQLTVAGELFLPELA